MSKPDDDYGLVEPPDEELDYLINESHRDPMVEGAAYYENPNAILHHSERWQDPTAPRDAIISQWRGEVATVTICSTVAKRDTLDACQRYLTEAGFVRVPPL